MSRLCLTPLTSRHRVCIQKVPFPGPGLYQDTLTDPDPQTPSLDPGGSLPVPRCRQDISTVQNFQTSSLGPGGSLPVPRHHQDTSTIPNFQTSSLDPGGSLPVPRCRQMTSRHRSRSSRQLIYNSTCCTQICKYYLKIVD
jgi:hypothetical protein